MQVIRELKEFAAPWEAAVLTLGVFDGMHRGHQALIERVQKRSRRDDRARLLVTYHPHPDLVLGKRDGRKGSELFTYEEKISLFEPYNLDAVIFLPFTLELARMTALRYLKDILLSKLHASHIIIGYDQRFGRGRKGDFHFLKTMSRRYDYRVERIAAVRYRGEVVSSSRIRALIREGEMHRANRLLGHDFFVTGIVVRGDRRGRDLGFPTANLLWPESKILPGRGVYTAIAEWNGRRYRAMVNIGTNPTFEESVGYKVEAHLLDFEGDLYG
ncbi:MAG: riboflavin biosynthesis protein RibF, partial [Leptospiraceae bacterium]|nr:riboflavin biosynthesis protein RibF [Leptospiraceae bacterium]